MGRKRCYFEKQTGEVVENKGKGYMDSQKQTGKQSGEVVENTFLWKKLTENKPENEPGHVAENKQQPKTNRAEGASFVTLVEGRCLKALKAPNAQAQPACCS